MQGAGGSEEEEKQLRKLWKDEQNRLKASLKEDDDFSWELPEDVQDRARAEEQQRQRAPPLRYVGGVDISFFPDSEDDACACLVILELPSLEVIYEAQTHFKLQLPYIPGFLAFREVSPLLNLIKELQRERPEILPQVVLVDGNGILHSRSFGLASHLGVLADLPTIGVAKTFFHVDGWDNETIKDRIQRHLLRSAEGEYVDHFDIIGQSGKIWGAAYFSSPGIKKAVYVSTGHRVSLKTALQIVRVCSLHRIPEPIRQADLRSRARVRQWKAEGNFVGAVHKWMRRP